MVGGARGTMERAHEVRKIVMSYFDRGIGNIRGPLTMEEIEDIEKKHTDSAEHFAESMEGMRQLFETKLRQGDEVYFYESDTQSWADLHGWMGYVVIRGTTVTYALPVAIN
jgi:hypothetical protein